ncbi:DUF6282 family protein [Cytobacillus sp. Hz8]|uniref:DUF6282 family protein n=1 Tax=Cytobacillus sp. Hz8 TaxID=3347168 RepID=UPI0035D7F44B
MAIDLDLIKGAYDLHIHTGPDVMTRKLDDLEMAERAIKAGMKGWAIKSHYIATSGRARLINKLYPELNVVGTVTLNNAVGGLNYLAVEMAARDGAKLVWMPTCDSTNEQEFFKKGSHKKLPFWAKLQMELIDLGKISSSISVLDENGGLRKEAIEVLDVIVQYNMILATGHLGKKESYALVKKAKDMGIKKIILTHPDFPSQDYTKEEQKEFAEMGAYMEHCFTTPATGKTTWEAAIEQIRHVGPEKVVLSTDLGQPANVFPDEGLLQFAQRLTENGFTKEEVMQMTVTNNTQLVEE